MSNNCAVGYCPALYEALQTVGHQACPYEPTDLWPPKPTSYHNENREVFIKTILKALVGDNDAELDPDDYHYLCTVYNAVDDDILRKMLENGDISELMVDDQGYYLAMLG